MLDMTSRLVQKVTAQIRQRASNALSTSSQLPVPFICVCIRLSMPLIDQRYMPISVRLTVSLVVWKFKDV